MKIIASFYKLEELKSCIDLIDAAILTNDEVSLNYGDLILDEAIDFCLNNNVVPYISMNRIFMENEMQFASEFIDKYKNCHFVISDLGLANLFESKGMLNKVIFDSSTMVCNSLDLDMYSKLGFQAVSMSNEITIDDLTKSYNFSKGDIFYQVFGRKLMFYSKRKLLSCYENHSSQKFERNNLFIKEEKRNDLMPIFETKNAYLVYRDYFISLLKEMKNLSFLKYAFFESITLNTGELQGILKIFKDYIVDKIGLDQAEENLTKYNLKICDGFAYSDSVHTKEKIINEKN